MTPVDKACVSVEHYTPPWLTDVVRRYGKALGFDGIELDPATDADNWTGAGAIFTEKENGLRRSWNVRRRPASAGGTFVFNNPPYGGALRTWVERNADQAADNTITLLVPGQRFEQRYFERSLFVLPRLRLFIPLVGRVGFFSRVCARCDRLEGAVEHRDGPCRFRWSGQRRTGAGNPYGSFVFLLGPGHCLPVARRILREVGYPITPSHIEPFSPLPGSAAARRGIARPGLFPAMEAE